MQYTYEIETDNFRISLRDSTQHMSLLAYRSMT